VPYETEGQKDGGENNTSVTW